MKFTTIIAAATLSNVVFAAPLPGGTEGTGTGTGTGSVGSGFKLNLGQTGDPWDGAGIAKPAKLRPEMNQVIGSNAWAGLTGLDAVKNPNHDVNAQNMGVRIHKMAETGRKAVVGAAAVAVGVRAGAKPAVIQKITKIVTPRPGPPLRFGANSRMFRTNSAPAGMNMKMKMPGPRA